MKEQKAKVYKHRWAIAALVLSLLVVAMAITWGVVGARQAQQTEDYRRQIDNQYRQAYYTLTYRVSNLSDTLNKLLLVQGGELRSSLLLDASTHAAASVTALSTLADTHSIEKTTKYINQIADYCMSLHKKISRGESLTEEDRDNLIALYQVLLEVERGLMDAGDEVEQDGYEWMTALSDSEGAFAVFLSTLESTTIAYPSLIYDGPFSDALETPTPEGLFGRELSALEAGEVVAGYVPYTARSVEYLGAIEGSIKGYRFRVSTDRGDYDVEISQKGGLLMEMDTDVSPEDTTLDEEQAVQYGADYLSSIGLDTLQCVWVSNYNSVYYLNFAHTQEGVICYSDLVVVKVNAQTGDIVGAEALGYLYHHTERTIDPPTVNETEARQAVSANIEIHSVRQALVPTDGGKERLTWEIYGKVGDETYFIYVDAYDGQEMKIMRVVDSANGKLVL